MNKEVSLKSFVIVMTVLVIIEIILLFVFSPRGNLDNYSSEYCSEAVCNEDLSLCYAYDLDEAGNTVVVWRGSCQEGN
mgnify:CR=1 FL=1